MAGWESQYGTDLEDFVNASASLLLSEGTANQEKEISKESLRALLLALYKVYFMAYNKFALQQDIKADKIEECIPFSFYKYAFTHTVSPLALSLANTSVTVSRDDDLAL